MTSKAFIQGFPPCSLFKLTTFKLETLMVITPLLRQGMIVMVFYYFVQEKTADIQLHADIIN